MLLITADVAFRVFASAPLPRVPEIIGYSIVAITFLQISNAIRRRRLTRSDALINWLEEKYPAAAASIHFVFNLSGSAVMMLICVGVWPELLEAWEYNDYFGSNGDVVVPIWPFRAVVILCVGIATFEFLVETFLNIRSIICDEPEHPDAHKGLPKGYRVIIPFAIGLTVLAWLLANVTSSAGIALILVIAMVALILLGAPIGVALAGLSFLGVWFLRGDVEIATNMLKIAATGAIQNQLFGVVPLFVLMGMLVNAARIGRDAFDVCQWGLQKLMGGLGIATVAANTVFAAITGISIASAVVFTRVAVPPMMEQGYSARFAVGIVAGSSVLGMLLPPSLLLIVFGIMAEVSVGTLFTAAILPGIVLAFGFSLVIYLLCRFTPNFVGNIRVARTQGLPSAWTRKPEHSETYKTAILKVIPITILILAVLGGIYGGFFTPTEAGAIGAFFAFILYAIRAAVTPGLFTWAQLWKLLLDTGQISVSILFVILAANMYTRMIALSGLPTDVVNLVIDGQLGFWLLIIVYLLVLLVMGMILDSISIMLITLPLILPILSSFGVDLIWFGILTVIAIEVGLLTPPLGLSVFVVKAALGNTQVTLRDIFIGTSPFVVTMIAMIGLLMLFPQLTSILR